LLPCSAAMAVVAPATSMVVVRSAMIVFMELSIAFSFRDLGCTRHWREAISMMVR